MSPLVSLHNISSVPHYHIHPVLFRIEPTYSLSVHMFTMLCLLGYYALATSRVISGWVPTYECTHENVIVLPRGNLFPLNHIVHSNTRPSAREACALSIRPPRPVLPHVCLCYHLLSYISARILTAMLTIHM